MIPSVLVKRSPRFDVINRSLNSSVCIEIEAIERVVTGSAFGSGDLKQHPRGEPHIKPNLRLECNLDSSSTLIRGRPRKISEEWLNTYCMGRDSSLSNVDRGAVAEFLELKGSVELLVVLSDSEVPYSEFETQVPVSTSTFHVRRERAVELQLIDSNRKQTETGFETVYTLTSLGEVLTQKIRESGLVKLFWRLQEIREQYDEARDEVPEWVRETSDDFEGLQYRYFSQSEKWASDRDAY